MYDYFNSLSLPSIVLHCFLANVGMFLLAILVFKIFHYFHDQFRNPIEKHPVSREDIAWAIVSVISNTLILIPGWYLWKNGTIVIVEDSLLRTIVMFLLMVLSIDLLMYIFHRIAHFKIVYKIIHNLHHNHEKLNAISLYVLNPIEALSFGIFIIIFMMLIDISLNTLLCFLIFNLVWGIMGHLGLRFASKNGRDNFVTKIVTNSFFHETHHIDQNYNFGFYTRIWDRIFKTEKSN